MKRLRYAIAGITHPGKLRSSNQDRILIRQKENLALLAVADGMGGLADGEKASEMVVAGLACWWEHCAAATPLEALSQTLDSTIYEVHRRIYYLAEQTGQQSGSTLSALLLQDYQCLSKQIGDSRIYRFWGGRLEQMTVDQNWYNRMVRTGQLTPKQAVQNPSHRALVNAVGASEELEIVTEKQQLVPAMAFLVCSDGVYGAVTGQQLVQALENPDPDRGVRHLAEMVLQGRAADNLSAILCHITE